MFCRQPFWKQKEEFALMQGAQPAPVRSHAAFDNNLRGRANVIWNIRYGGRASIKTLVYCMWILIKIGQKNLWKGVRISLWKNNISNAQKKNTLNSLSAVCHNFQALCGPQYWKYCASLLCIPVVQRLCSPTVQRLWCPVVTWVCIPFVQTLWFPVVPKLRFPAFVMSLDVCFLFLRILWCLNCWDSALIK